MCKRSETAIGKHRIKIKGYIFSFFSNFWMLGPLRISFITFKCSVTSEKIKKVQSDRREQQVRNKKLLLYKKAAHTCSGIIPRHLFAETFVSHETWCDWTCRLCAGGRCCCCCRWCLWILANVSLKIQISLKILSQFWNICVFSSVVYNLKIKK